jgi:hypothetical protein
MFLAIRKHLIEIIRFKKAYWHVYKNKRFSFLDTIC